MRCVDAHKHWCDSRGAFGTLLVAECEWVCADVEWGSQCDFNWMKNRHNSLTFSSIFFPRQWFAFKFLKENIIAIALAVLPWTVWGNKHETEVVFRYQFAVFAIACSEPMAVVEQHLMLWPCWSVGATTLVGVAVYAGNCAGGSIKFRALYKTRFEVHQNESIVCCLCCCHYDTTNCCWNIFYFDVLWLRWPWIGCFSV